MWNTLKKMFTKSGRAELRADRQRKRAQRRESFRQFKAIAKPYWTSEVKWKAIGLFATVLALTASVNGLNVIINFVAGQWQTSMQGLSTSHDLHTFFHLTFMYFMVFVVGTPIVVFNSWVQDKLNLHWRTWLTKHIFAKYMENRNYYRVNEMEGIDNPDERIASDISSFTSQTLSLLMSLLSSILQFVSFIVILVTLSKLLTLTVLIYAVIGTVATFWLGRRLVPLRYNQLRVEANFRYNLIHVRTNTESIAFYQGEEQESKSVMKRFGEAVGNFNLLIGWQRNLSFLTTGYGYLVVLIPSLIMAPMYSSGLIDFGAIGRADMAFGQVLAAMSVLISAFDTIASFRAVTRRLGTFYAALDIPATECGDTITTTVAPEIRYADVTVQTPDCNRDLAKHINVTVKPGTGLLIKGPSGSGKSSILRATGGLRLNGSGTIFRPDLKDVLFLPQRPYMAQGSLREQLLYPRGVATDEQVKEALAMVNLPDLADRVGGLDTSMDWPNVLSVGEQQRLAFARLLIAKPKYAFLDEATSALDVGNEEKLYRLLQESGCTFVSVGHRPTLEKFHANVLELIGDGQYRIYDVKTDE